MFDLNYSLLFIIFQLFEKTFHTLYQAKELADPPADRPQRHISVCEDLQGAMNKNVNGIMAVIRSW